MPTQEAYHVKAQDVTGSVLHMECWQLDTRRLCGSGQCSRTTRNLVLFAFYLFSQSVAVALVSLIV